MHSLEIGKKKQRAIKEEIESNRTKHKDSVLNLENDFEKNVLCVIHFLISLLLASNKMVSI